MDKPAAAKIVRDTLQKPFEREQYARFARNLVSKLDESGDAKFTYQGSYVPHAFSPYIQSLERVGKYSSPDNKKIDILVANLKKGGSLERARTMQRNFIAWYLRSRDDKDAALVAFVSPEKADWRFSLVKLEYELALTPKGKVKPQEELTPARRWSFLVGEHESTHTAQSRLVPVLQNDAMPALSDLEEAFNIEVVTREFFTQYRELFNDVSEELERILKRDKQVADEFTKQNIEASNFTKKLLGQIVFLYFLQKKGWFGVGRDAAWGTGPRNFLRQLFNKDRVPYKNS